MKSPTLIYTPVLVFFIVSSVAVMALQESECPVCFSIVKKLDKIVKETGNVTAENYAQEFLDLCEHPTKTEKSFCYYMGGDKNSATRTYGDMTTRMAQGLPPAKICEYLKSKGSPICELREKQTVKLRDLDMDSLKPSKLRQILNDKGDPCKGCVEKSEFIARLKKIRDSEEESTAEL